MSAGLRKRRGSMGNSCWNTIYEIEFILSVSHCCISKIYNCMLNYKKKFAVHLKNQVVLGQVNIKNGGQLPLGIPYKNRHQWLTVYTCHSDFSISIIIIIKQHKYELQQRHLLFFIVVNGNNLDIFTMIHTNFFFNYKRNYGYMKTQQNTR